MSSRYIFHLLDPFRDVRMRPRLCFASLLVASLIFAVPAGAQEEKWQVGQHPDYHVAMVKQVDQVLVAIYVPKKPTMYGTPLLMETVLAPCGEKKPISMHATEALLVFSTTAEERLSEVRDALHTFLEGGKASCKLADNIEERFFHRFDEAYAATDAILVEAGVLPLADPFSEDENRDGAKG